MIEVLMKSTDAGPLGVKHSGKKYLVDDVEARDLVAGGFAVYTSKTIQATTTAPAEVSTVDPNETTTTAPAETATAHKGKRGRR